MKKDLRLVVFLVFFLIILSSLSPTTTYATNGHQLSAIGAYQQGMGGAVTAAPYDASTAIANPAGMALIGNRTDFSFQTFFPTRGTSFGAGGGTTTGGSNLYLVPAVGWSAPVSDRDDLFFGGGMYGVSGLGADYDTVPAGAAFEGMLGMDLGSGEANVWSQYQFWKMAPTLAWKKDKLALGFALNLDYQAFGFKEVFTGTMGATSVTYGMDLSEMQGALGYGATVGAIYKFSPVFTAGASYASKQKFSDFKWRLANGDVNWMGKTSKNGIYTLNLDFPQQFAFGIAVRPVKKLLWTADVKWINYADTYKAPKLKGDFIGPIGGTELTLDFGWDDVWVYATGLQYDVTPNLAVRVGYNYSTSPINQDDSMEVENNIALPAIVKQRMAGGFTYRFGRHWEFTGAYMIAPKTELTGAVTGTKILLKEQAADFEISYRF